MSHSNSIFARVFNLLIFTGTLLFIGLTVSLFFFNSSVNENDNNSKLLISNIISTIENGKYLEKKNIKKLPQLIANYSNRSSFYRVSVINKDGIIISSTEPDIIGVPMMNDMIMYVLNRGRVSFPRNTYYENVKVIERAYPIKSGDKNVGVLLVDEYIDGYNNKQGVFFPKISLVMMILFGFFIVVIFGIYLTRYFSRLGKLTGAVSKFARGDYNHKVELSPDSEFGLLAESFNQIRDTMMDRIQERELLNKTLERSNKEKEKNLKILSQMAGGVAHEVRNPLGGIKGFTELLRNEMDKNDPKLKYVDIILSEVNSLEALVQSVLDFARPRKPGYSAISLDTIIESITPSLDNKISDISQEGVHITFKYDIVPEVNKIEVDSLQLRQVLHNMLLNSCDAMSEKGGKLLLKARKFREEEKKFFEVDDISKYFAIEIIDEGEGIDEETLENIFTPFYTTKANGTGLGLAICQKIIENHKGKIRIESVVDKGTTIYIYLPLKEIEERIIINN